MTERNDPRIDGLPDLPKLPEPDGYAAIAPEGTHSIVVRPDQFGSINGYAIFTADQMNAHYLKGYEAGSAAAAQAAKQVPAGFVLVPQEITADMTDAWVESPTFEVGYHALLAAAPSATSLAEAAALCVCGDRPATECDEEWGPKCDLGNNAAHAQVSTTDPALIDAALAAPEAAEAGLLTNVGTDKPLNTSSTFASPEVMRSALAATPASPQAPAPQAVVGEASEDPYFGVQDEVCLTRAVCVMNDVLTDISGWEDQALAEAVKSSKVDLCAMIECIRMRADDSYVPGTKPIDGEVCTPSPAPSAAPHQGADALREALQDLHQVMLESMRTGGWVPTPIHQSFVAAMQDARAALAQHQAPQQGEPK